MRKNFTGNRGPATRLLLLGGAMLLAGCETVTDRMTLPPSPPANGTAIGPSTADRPAAQDAVSTPSKELDEALQEHAEALAALKVAMRALEASDKRLEALAKKGNAVGGCCSMR